MTDRDDEIDPADWLAQQFGADPVEPEKPEPPVAPEPPAVPPAPVVPPAPAVPSTPVVPPTPAAPPVAPPVIVPPAFSPTPLPEVPLLPEAPRLPEPLGAPAAPPAPSASFNWGLTPGGEQPPAVPPEPTPAAPVAPPVPEPALPPVAPPPPVTPPVPAPTSSADIPTAAIDRADIPTAAIDRSDLPNPPVNHADVSTVAMQLPPGQELDTVAFDASQWQTASIDPALEGMTEVIEAEIVGLPVPEGEGLQPSAIDSLFDDTQFQDYEGQSLIPVAPRAPNASPKDASRLPKILLWVAIGLLAVLALIALFVLGTRLGAILGAPAAVVESPSPTPTPTPEGPLVGPVAVGEHQWDELLGGECLKPWESAWQDTYTVVDCATPHPAQLVFRGRFDDAAGVAYPGVEELQKRINLLCTPTSVIDYSKAGMLSDIQVLASFAATADDWNDGNRTFFCFVNRSSGQDLTESVAVPQVPATGTGG